MNSFHYLFKYIVIGDSGTRNVSQLLGSRPSCSSSSIASLSLSTTPLLGSNSGPNCQKSRTKLLNYKSGTLLGRKTFDPSRVLTTGRPSGPSLYTTLRGTDKSTEARNLQSRQELAEGSQDQRELLHRDHSGRQQERSRGEEAGHRGGGQAYGCLKQNILYRNQRHRVRQGRKGLQPDVGVGTSKGR
jgi:hypothetical protein